MSSGMGELETKCCGRPVCSNSRRSNQRSPDNAQFNIIWGGTNAMHGFWSGNQLLIYLRVTSLSLCSPHFWPRRLSLHLRRTPSMVQVERRYIGILMCQIKIRCCPNRLGRLGRSGHIVIIRRRLVTKAGDSAKG